MTEVLKLRKRYNMPVLSLKELKANLAPNQRLLGLDQGTKTIGLALSDPNLSFATPLETIKRTKFTQDVKRIAQVIKDYNVGGLVIGLPLNMDGSEGPRCVSVRHFGDNLMRSDAFETEPIITFCDERLSTHAVETFLIEERDMSRKKRKDVIDALAAQCILQGALDL